MIEISQDGKSAMIDRETHNRLTQGTRFQRSMNLLAELDKTSTLMEVAFMKAAGMNRQKRRIQLKQLRKGRADFLRKNPPPMEGGFDLSAIDAYYG